MEDKKVQKINRTLQGVNAGVREMVQRFDDYLKSQSFATLDTAIAGGGVDNAPTSQITTISCSALKGEIPKDSYFIISYPDGTHPKSILNKKSDLAAGATSIVIHDGSGVDDQTYYADFPYPVGSLLSAVQYAGNDTQFAAGNTTEIQYNTSGQLSADSNFTYNDGTDTLSATNIVGDLTGDVTGNVTSNILKLNTLTQTEIDAITPEEGMVLYNQSKKKIQIYSTSSTSISNSEFTGQFASPDGFPYVGGTQSFIAPFTGTIYGISLYLRKIEDACCSIGLSFDGSGSGIDRVDPAYENANENTPFWYEFTFDIPINVTFGQQYGFIVEGINANPANEAALGNVVVTPNSLKTSDPEGAWTAYMNWFVKMWSSCHSTSLLILLILTSSR